MSADDEREVTVCAACLRASCWTAVFMCDKAASAATTTRTVAQLRALDLEHPDYWEEPDVPEPGAADEFRRGWYAGQQQEKRLHEQTRAELAKYGDLAAAVIDLCWRATPFGEDADGFVDKYLLTTGTVHRLIGAAQCAGISAAFRSPQKVRSDQEQADQHDREQRAKGWDECWKVAGDYAAALMLGKRVPEPPNPYREADQ
jgi:hypothetical protein